MTPADKFYMNYSPNCCHKPDCKDVDCSGRYADTQPPVDLDKDDKADVYTAIAIVLVFVGFIVWSLK